MSEYSVALLTGDGVGNILCEYSEKYLKKLADKYGFSVSAEKLPFGKSAYNTYGNPLPEDTVSGMKNADSSVLFAVDSDVPGSTPVGRLRKTMNLYAEVRSVKSLPGRWALKDNINLAFVRELTEGFLADRNMKSGNGEFMPDPSTACSIRVITEKASHNIAEYAFDYAEKMGYSKITAVHKASILKMTCGLFLQECRKVAELHKNIAYEEKTADDVAGDLISSPESFGVILTTNMFGDILSDEGSALVSGLCVGINVGTDSKLFMPVRHSAAYDGLKRDDFDPVPYLLCIGQMLKGLGEDSASEKFEKDLFTVSGKGSLFLKNLLEQL